MSFAIFYQDSDAQFIADALNRSDLTNTERQTATKIWNGGAKNWATSPFGLSPCADPLVCDPTSSRRCVITAQGVTKQDMADLLIAIGTRIGGDTGSYLRTLGLDVSLCSVEPA